MITYFCTMCNLDTDKSECPHCGIRTKMHSKLYWCNECNIPIYDEVCPDCGNIGKYLATDVRPVFPEERLLLEIMLGKPLEFIEKSVWNAIGNRYYVDGERIKFPVSNLDKFDPALIREQLSKYSLYNNYKYFNDIIRKFVCVNSRRFEYTTTEAREWIRLRAETFDNSGMFVSFSGGKDSTVVSDLVVKALGRPDIIHIFGNTTLEFPQTYEYVERFKKNNRKTPLLKGENKEQDFFNLCEIFGPPSRMLRWCCTIFKTGFIGDKIQKTFKNKKTILTFYGIRRIESTSRNSYDRNSTSPKISKQKVASPIIDWTDFDIWLYILSTGIDFNEAYRLGYTRVGCWLCPNNSRWSQFLTSVYMPEQSKRFYNMLYNFAVKMGKTNPEDYVKSGGWKARQGGAGIEMSKNVAIDFKPCATDAKSFNYILNEPISEELYELFKPFGILNFDMGNVRLGEVFILDAKSKQPIMKLQGRKGMDELKITILSTPIAERKKTVEIEMKFKCQITKFQLCQGCHACENVCKHNAIKLIKIDGFDNEYKYEIDENKCIHCYECINHYSGGCYMRKVLLPRGKGYSQK